jgi:ABC-2 type transport system permease protein
MNGALWKKAYGEVRLVLPLFIAVMFGFQVLHVWVASQLDLQLIRDVLNIMPDFMKRVLPVSVDTLASYTGRVAIGYDHPIVAFGFAFWAVARGSDAVSGPLNRGTLETAVSGPLNRGTLETVLAQPVRRTDVLLSNAVVATLGTALMATACWLGTFTSLSLIPKLHDISPLPYIHCAVNLFAYAFFLGGMTTLISSADRYRGRTIGIAAAMYVIAVVLKLTGRMAAGFESLAYFSFLTPYEPQRFIDPQFDPAMLAVNYDVPLVVLGLACYVIAVVIFAKRDLPAPL